MSAAVLLCLSMCAHAQDASVDDAGKQLTAPFLGGFLKESRVVYPLKMGPWESRGEHLYEQQELGASVRYMHANDRDRWIDVYFYPAGVLEDEAVATAVDQTLEGIRAALAQAGNYGEVDIGKPSRLEYRLGSGKDKRKVVARSASMHLVRDGKAYHSSMVMLVQDLFFLKARYSVEEDAMSRRQAQKQLEDFMGRMVRLLSLRSTGGCWMPLPILRKDSLDATGAITTNTVHGSLTAVAFPDRVEALDPASPEATMLKLVAMSMTDRLFEGCVAPEDMNAPVPDDRREIRLEFIAPTEDGDGTSSPLRQRRRSVT